MIYSFSLVLEVFMLTSKKGFHQLKTLVILVLTISLASCSDGNKINNSPTDSASSTSPASSVSSASPQATNSPTSIAIPGVNNVGEINFKPASKNPPGFFDSVNRSITPRIEVQETTPIIASGWATLADESRPADMVIITSGNDNSLVAVAPVNLERPDVVKSFKNPAYKNSGWVATFSSSTLPADQVVLKAWAFNSATKEATPLSKTFEVVVVK